MIASETRIGTGTLKDRDRTDRVKKIIQWHGPARYPSDQLRMCRNCENGQVQGRRFVCLIAGIETRRTARCCRLYQYGQNRLYADPAGK